MGTYTPTFKLYKATSDEIVDVEIDLNDNWRILDTALRNLFSYEYTNVRSVTTYIPDRKAGYRYYKTRSNAVFTQELDPSDPNASLVQDTSARVYTWVDASNLVQNPWVPHPDYPPYYRIVPISGNINIQWTGTIWQSGATIPLNTNYKNVMNLPSNIAPVVSKYFQRCAGNGSGGPSLVRWMFNSDGQVEIYRSGYATTSSDENKLDLGGIQYNVGVSGS